MTSLQHRTTLPPVRDADSIVRLLGLQPHPEGGFYRETFRATAVVGTRDDRGERAASTAIPSTCTRWTRAAPTWSRGSGGRG
jgi:predicted cupin superfamily sugar epimerase